MSRLDIFIDRMVSQRACLDYAAAQTASLTGPVFELGLGNGRTYHHLAEITSLETILKAADQALYRAKSEGRNRVMPCAQPAAKAGKGADKG